VKEGALRMERAKWCPLCERYVFVDKSIPTMGWMGFVALIVYGGALLVAYVTSAAFANYLNSTQGALSSLGFTAIAALQLFVLYSLWPLVAVLFLVSVIYLIAHELREPVCPICNSWHLSDVPAQ
jgi:hypothetical protein